MSDDPVDTGFDAVLAGERWEAPEPDGATYAAVSKAETPPDELADLDAKIAAALTATVTEPDLPAPAPVPEVTNGLTPAGVQAAKALVNLPKLDWPQLAALARDIAMDIKERHDILREFGLTETQYDFLAEYNEFYRQTLASACKDWHSPRSVQERLALEAAAILEDGLPSLGARFQNKGEGLPGVVEAGKLLAKIAGAGDGPANQAATGERFVINIDLGGDKSLTVETKAAPRPPTLDLLASEVEQD